MENKKKSQLLVKEKSVLRELRENKQLSRESLASIMGVTSKTIQRWEGEDKELSLTANQWLKLCNTLGVRFTEIPAYFSSNNF
jgi:DNA-binding transcriptional regulator YiaG